ncbi:MAG TPA: hypothetical protein PK878_17175 [bacterium]|nr:hypothetical protein [Candidatus Omnitrophota bacterium]HOJ62017.1 hypothetical protein [bacterium]HOL96795.1 hypothetical protein [bacterium]HPP03123.1 hypothetical protein [bacterium]HXK95000.1 hypothetical protein [bacterium]
MKYLYFVLVLCLCASVGFSQEIVENFFTPDGGNSPITLNGGQKCAQRFTATLPFEGIQVNGPTWSVNGEKGMTIRLYKWAGSYASTVAQPPLATSVLVDLNDNDWFLCAAGSELPPGEYLWEASEPTNSNPDAVDPFQIGCWLYNGSKYKGGEAYFNGVPYGEVSVLWVRQYGSPQAGTWTPVPFPDGDNPTLAQSFFTSGPFQAVGIASPTWNGYGAGYRLRLYKWNTDYDTTVAQSPIAEKTIENHSDNARGELLLTAPQPEGKYLLLTDMPVRGTGNVGHWGWSNSDWWDPDTIAYSNGEEIANYFTFDLFLGEPSEEEVGKDFASRSVTGVATRVSNWAVY